jgi:hypothetical protein
MDWCYLGSEGASKGILFIWDRRVVEKMEVCVGCFIIACSFRSVNDNFEWAFAGVSSPNDDNNRQFSWDELVGIMSLWEMPWCIGGDFNAIRLPSERVGVTRYSTPMGEFSSFFSDQGLMDIPLMGGQYTWSNNHCWSRIDKFLFSPRWEEKFLDMVQRRLPHLLSDHFPILLDCGVRNRSRGCFKFEKMWLKFEGFVDQVKIWWQSYQFHGSPSPVLACKLKALKGDLQRWNNEIFGNIGKRKKVLLDGIRELGILGDG